MRSKMPSSPPSPTSLKRRRSIGRAASRRREVATSSIIDDRSRQGPGTLKSMQRTKTSGEVSLYG